MHASHLARRAALAACAAAACGFTDCNPAPGDGGVDSGSAVPPAPEAGRYWAHVFAHGITAAPIRLWFEYEPDSVPTGSSSRKPPSARSPPAPTSPGSTRGSTA